MNREMLGDQLAQVHTELLLLKKQIDKVYKDYIYEPYDKIKDIPFSEFIKTRFISLEEHHKILQEKRKNKKD